MTFPKDFVWGAAAASYQIEGGARADGKGESVWDVFARKQGAVWRAQTGDVACDRYHRYAEDVALMKQIGRFSHKKIRGSERRAGWRRLKTAFASQEANLKPRRES